MAADTATSAKDLTYITEQYPPYNYQEDGRLQGISVDLLEKVWERMGINLNRSVIQLLPWTEGYERTLKENNTVLFTTFRIPEREPLFKWAGPIATGRDALLARSDRNITIATPEDLKKYRIGGIVDDIAVQRLLNNGLKKEDLVLEVTSAPIIEMLKNGTIDAWAYNDLAGIWMLQQSGANASDYKVAYVLAQGDGYYAFNRETPDSIVQSFQEAIDDIKGIKGIKGSKGNEEADVAGDYDNYDKSTSLNETELTELVSFVESAVAYAHENGKDVALKEFSNKTGSFVQGDLYIYAYGFNGTNIAHPFKSDWIGKDKLNETDSNGVMYIRNLINAARVGKGFTYFIFPNPAHDNRKEFKIGYAMKVDDDWWLGSGLYFSDVSASFDQEGRDELVAFVEEALGFAKKNGKEKSLEVFNDPSGNFTRDGRYIFAYDYEGQTLALPYQPDLIGTNRTDAQDPNGVYFVQHAIYVARMGNGFFYYIYPDASRNMTQALKLSYVANVDDTWFLGSGIYAESEEAD